MRKRQIKKNLKRLGLWLNKEQRTTFKRLLTGPSVLAADAKVIYLDQRAS